MEEITGIFNAIGKGWTPGAVGIWILVIGGLGTWWKGLPAVMDAWSNSVARERTQREAEISREQDHREKEIGRLEGQIAAADKRHEECLEGQKRLRAEISHLNETISGMVIQIRQMQISGANLTDISPAMTALLGKMK